MKPGRPARFDYEYERNGTANIFMMFAPLEGWRHVKVTDRHTAVDYAHVLKELADTHFPDAKTIVLVQDNLNIHSKASLYEAFPAAEARRLVERFEWHYTPKSTVAGSIWRNPAWGPVVPVPRPPHSRQTNPHRRNRCLGARPQCQPHQGQLALHNPKCTYQTQAPLPFNLTEFKSALEHRRCEAQSAGAIAGVRVAARPQATPIASRRTRNPLTRSGHHGNVEASGTSHRWGAGARLHKGEFMSGRALLLGSWLAALAALPVGSAHAANWVEENFYLSGPRYDGVLPPCDAQAALSKIAARFGDKEHDYWNSSLKIAGFDRIREIAYRPWAANTIPRRFCSAVVRSPTAATIRSITRSARTPA